MTENEKNIKDSWDDDDNISIHYFLYEYKKQNDEDK